MSPFFSGEELVAVFASWLKRQPPEEPKKINTTEQDGAGQPPTRPEFE